MPERFKRWHFTRGLRFRLTLIYVVFFAALFVLVGIAFRQSLVRTLDEQARAALEEEWGAIKGYLRIERHEATWFYDRDDPEETFIVERLRQVFLLADKKGQIMYASPLYNELGDESPQTIKEILATHQPSWRIKRTEDGQSFMIRAGVLIDDSSQEFFCAVGRSLAENEATVRGFTRNYFLLLPIWILPSSLLGWWVAGSALKPLSNLAHTADRITSSNLNVHIPLRGAGDELDHLIGTLNSMTERLASQFEQTRQFSTDVSHELRTPLTVIRGQLEVALITAKTEEQYRDAMASALQEVERLSRTVRTLLLLSQAESGQLSLQWSRFDMAALVRDIVEQFQLLAEEAKVTLSCSAPLTCVIEADRLQIERLLSNLLSNAMKYAAGSSVDVRLSGDNDTVRLEIEDTGMGIAPEHLPHIFDRLYRVPGAASGPEKGLGLGLSFVAWIVKAHGGTVNVESAPGRGSKFTITLPATSRTVQAAGAEVALQ